MTSEIATYPRPRQRARPRFGRGSRTGALAPREISPAVRATVELLDQRFRIPVLGLRFGMDAVLGLIPLVGDAIGMLLGYGLVLEAIRLRARWRVVARMLGNLWFDAIMGAVPLVGDVFDFVYHPHRKNLELLEAELARG